MILFFCHSWCSLKACWELQISQTCCACLHPEQTGQISNQPVSESCQSVCRQYQPELVIPGHEDLPVPLADSTVQTCSQYSPVLQYLSRQARITLPSKCQSSPNCRELEQNYYSSIRRVDITMQLDSVSVTEPEAEAKSPIESSTLVIMGYQEKFHCSKRNYFSSKYLEQAEK